MYSNILYKWMSGHGLSSIISRTIKYKDNPETGIWVNNWKVEVSMISIMQSIRI